MIPSFAAITFHNRFAYNPSGVHVAVLLLFSMLLLLLTMQLLCFHCVCCIIVDGVSFVVTNAVIVVSVDVYLMLIYLFSCSICFVPVAVIILFVLLFMLLYVLLLYY